MSYTAIRARNNHSELCQSKQGFFFVRIERCFDYCKNDKTWSDWLPVIAIERNKEGHIVAKIDTKVAVVEIKHDSEGHIVAKIDSTDSFVYTAIEKRTVNYLMPRIGGIVNAIPE